MVDRNRKKREGTKNRDKKGEKIRNEEREKEERRQKRREVGRKKRRREEKREGERQFPSTGSQPTGCKRWGWAHCSKGPGTLSEFPVGRKNSNTQTSSFAPRFIAWNWMSSRVVRTCTRL